MPEIIRTRHRRHHDDYSSSSDDRDGDYKTVRRYIIRESDRDSDYRPRSADHSVVSTRIVERPRSYVEYDRELSYDREEPERRLRTVVYERDEPRVSREVRAWDTWDRENEVRVERRREEPHYELVTRETDYYARPEPAQQLVIRQKAPEQRIIVEAPQPTVEVVHRHEIVENREVPRPESRREEDTYYRRHEIRDTASPEDDYYSERRAVRRRGSGSSGEWSTDENVVVRRTPRGRSRSHSPHHKLHLAEGAAAGATAGAIIAHHRSKSGRRESKAAQVASGAVLGTIGAELATHARRRYSHKSRSRGRSSSPENSKLKMGLGAAALVGATALAAGKYFKDRRDDRRAEEARGRSRTRSRSRPPSASSEHKYRHLDPKHRSDSIARAGAAGAAALAIAEAVQARSRSRKGEKTRSKSRIRTGAEIVGAGLATAAAAGIYENHQAKKEAKEQEQERARSRSLSRPRSGYEEDGLVEYGASPLHSGRSESGRSRSRSKSRVREAVGAAAATAAAAVGVHKYRDRKRRKEAEAAERKRGMRRYSSPESDTSDGYSDYSSSPPRASGGAYYPERNAFPPPPVPHHPHMHAQSANYPPPQPQQHQANPDYYDETREAENIA